MKELESAGREKAVRLLYQKVNSTRQNFKPRTTICKSKEGRIISDKGVLRRWREHFDGILNNDRIPISEPSPIWDIAACLYSSAKQHRCPRAHSSKSMES
jgi:hypothetical protein